MGGKPSCYMAFEKCPTKASTIRNKVAENWGHIWVRQYKQKRINGHGLLCTCLLHQRQSNVIASPGPTSVGTIKSLGVQLFNSGGLVPYSLSSMVLLFPPLHPDHPHSSVVVTDIFCPPQGASSLYLKSLWVFQIRLRNSPGFWHVFLFYFNFLN